MSIYHTYIYDYILMLRGGQCSVGKSVKAMTEYKKKAISFQLNASNFVWSGKYLIEYSVGVWFNENGAFDLFYPLCSLYIPISFQFFSLFFLHFWNNNWFMSTTKSQSITGLIIKWYPEGDRPKYTIIRTIINAICISILFLFFFFVSSGNYLHIIKMYIV